MGSGTHCSEIDGFPGTHGTHVNGATALIDLQERRLSAIDGIDICSLLYICYAYLGIIVSGRGEEVTLFIYIEYFLRKRFPIF